MGSEVVGRVVEDCRRPRHHPQPAKHRVEPSGSSKCNQCEESRRRARAERRPRRAAAESAPIIPMVLAPGLPKRALAELTSSSLTASTSPRRHAPRNTKSATNSATSCPAPASTNTPKPNASPAIPNHGTELVFSFLNDITLHREISQGTAPGSYPERRSRRRPHPVNAGDAPAHRPMPRRRALRRAALSPVGLRLL